MMFSSSALCRPKCLDWVVLLVGSRTGCLLMQVGLKGMRHLTDRAEKRHTGRRFN